MHGGRLWRKHPGVRSGNELTFGERAADRLKAAFGSWTFLILLNAVIIGWIALNAALPRAQRWDVFPFILLNLGLSWLAAQQGGALQIAANRGDRINAETALHTAANTDELMQLNRAQLEILARLDGLDGKVADLAQAVAVVMALRKDQAAKTPDLSDVLAELRAVRALVTPTGPMPAADKPEPPAKPRGSKM